MGVSVFGLSAAAVVVVAVVAAVLFVAGFLVSQIRGRTDRSGVPEEFPAAVCQVCAASISAGARNCPSCGAAV